MFDYVKKVVNQRYYRISTLTNNVYLNYVCVMERELTFFFHCAFPYFFKFLPLTTYH